MIVTCKKLGFETEGKAVSCEEDFEVEGYTVFTCPALYHKVKDRVDEYRVLDLRVLKAFKNPEKVAKSVLESEKVPLNYVFDTVQVGRDVVYSGDNLEIIEELSSHCNLTVVTDNEELIRRLYPYEVRVVRGKVKGIEGEVGNFRIYVDGYDLVEGRRVDVLRAGQVICKGFNGVEGIYGDDFHGAFKVLSNLGGYLKLVAVKVDHDICGAYKSGLKGCNHCLSCPSVSLKDGKVKVDLSTCKACGFCSSICFTSAMKSVLLPHDSIIERIDRVSNLGFDTLTFACERSLVDLNDLKELPDTALILLPCLNYLNEVHYLYAVLRGFKVLAIPCECDRFRPDCFEIASNTLKAFGFNCLRLTSWNDFERDLKSLCEPPNVRFELEGKNKREMWLSLVSALMVYEVKESRFDSKYFGFVEINENCTLCNSCVNFCPMNALRKEVGKIIFNHGLCIACELCSKACPENALRVEKGLDFQRLGERIVFEDEMVRCPRCGRPHISKRAYEKLKALTGMEKSLLFCKDCRPVTILEGVYEEIKRDLEELKRRRVGDGGDR